MRSARLGDVRLIAWAVGSPRELFVAARAAAAAAARALALRPRASLSLPAPHLYHSLTTYLRTPIRYNIM